MRTLIGFVVSLIFLGTFAQASSSGAISSAPAKGHVASSCINPNSNQYVVITELSASLADTIDSPEALVFLYDYTNQQNAPVWNFWLAVNPPYTVYASTPDVQPQPSSYSDGFTFPQGHTVCLAFNGVSPNAYETTNLSFILLP